jgi:hypothetical protein
MKQNYFKFKDNIYNINNALPMGNQLSPLLADIYMDEFEKILFQSNNNLLSCVSGYFRYVDDILCIWTGTKRQLDNFLKFINSINSNLQFT